MNKLRSKFNRFCYQHRDKGIPNLLAYILIAQVAVYVLTLADKSYTLYNLLSFNRDLIFRGQIWRIVSFLLLGNVGGNPVLYLVFTLCYYQIGRTLESVWGTLRFNLYYGTGILFLLLAGFLFNIPITPNSLHLSLFLAYATLFPDAQFMLLFIIPVKARWFGIAYLVLAALDLLNFLVFPFNLLQLFIFGNYILHFGKDIANLFPVSWQVNASRVFSKKGKPARPAKVIPFQQGRPSAAGATPYRHRCTVCGRTDAEYKDLEFRYCSKCSGYHCYCMDHINDHAHITE